jgi:triosephosphate isomerase
MNHIFIANWKMNQSLDSALNFCQKLEYSKVYKENILICAPQLYLLSLKEQFKTIKFAAQDVSKVQDNFGAYTGEVSALMLREQGIKYSLIGHSERRLNFSESDEIVKIKANNSIKVGITPIICIGEALKEREKGNYFEIIEKQIINSVPLIDQKIIIAYEPLWSIGTGLTPTNEQIEEIFSFILKILVDKGMLEKNIKLVYGGSVNSKNIENILSIKNIAGVLVGGASLNIDEFIKICQSGE